MKDHVIRKIRNNLRCRNDVDEDRLANENASQRFLIGFFDKLQWAALDLTSASELFQDTDEVRNAAGRRAPLQVDDLRALAHKVNRKHLKSDVDHARRCGKQVVPFCLARGFHDQFVRSIQGCLSILQAAGFCEPLATKLRGRIPQWQPIRRSFDMADVDAARPRQSVA
jgi:hypothetical protein